MASKSDVDDRDHATTALGAYIEFMRKLRGLSQEAVARGISASDDKSGCDKGYVSRVETGRIKLPKPMALRRIARGLGLDPYQIRLGFRAAGYQAWAGDTLVAPDEPARQRALDALDGLWLGHQRLPATALIDLQGTIWHASESFARLFSMVSAAELVGRHVLELCLDPRLGMAEALSGLVDEAKQPGLVAQAVAVYRVVSLTDGATLWRGDVLVRLRRLAGFGQLWNETRLDGTVAVDGLVRLPLTAGGYLLASTLPVVVDPRFLLVLITPSDGAAAAVIERRFE